MPAPGPSVNVIAEPTGAQLDAPSTNSALQLAGALKNTSEDINPVLTAIGDDMATKAKLRANTDALANSGQSWKDAVAAGTVSPTESPWYMQQYEQTAANVRSQAEISNKMTESQTWAERNDPDAFAARMDKEVGAIGQNYQGRDQQQGFLAAADPAIHQAIAQNLSYNVQRIQLDNIQDTTTQAQSSILAAQSANPSATPQAILASTDQAHQKWLNVGGTESDWRELLFNSIRGAAYATHDTSLLGLADAPYNGSTPLSQIAGKDGKPYAEQLSNDVFQIERASNYALNNETKQHTAQVQAEGQKFTDIIKQQYGLNIGTLTPEASLQIAKDNNISLDGYLAGQAQLGSELEKAASLPKALVNFNQADPVNVTRMLDYTTEAAKNGLVDDMVSRLKADVVAGRIQESQAQQIITEGAATNRAKFSEGMANVRESRNEHNANEAQARQALNDAKVHGKDYVDSMVDGVIFKVGNIPGDTSMTTAKDASTNRANATARIRGAFGAAYATNPDNYPLAQAQAQAEAAKIINERVAVHARRTNTAPTAPGSGLQQKTN